MYKFQKFKVVPHLPEKLRPLIKIAYNFWMTFNPVAIKLFITMDNELWERCNHNPVKMLGEIDQKRLEELAQDEGFLFQLSKVEDQLNNYLNLVRSLNGNQECSIAYFSAEYGLNDTLPIYSGGLGILSGDHVKSASDLNLNFVGIGLLYQNGYFQQYLNQDGWQQDFYVPNDFYNMQVQEVKDEAGNNVLIDLDFPGRKLFLKAWKIEVGRVLIYMLDSNLEVNGFEDRHLTAQLYGGNIETRLQQEIILGIGGMRLLDKLGRNVDVIHMNEGHSAFASLERIKLLMQKERLSFAEAFEVARKSNVFTTHTPVKAGHDEFSPDLLRKYFSAYIGELGINFNDFVTLGRIHPENQNELFSMTVAAIKCSAFINGVSRLHTQVSKDMWRELFSEVPFDHIPISSITNGVHIPSWISFELNDLFERYLGNKWREQQDYRDAWEKIYRIPDHELWSVKEIRRRRLIAFARQRLKQQLQQKGVSRVMIDEAEQVLDPDALTIGFARRFATYKRGNLILQDPERLVNILTNRDRPVQIIFVGKAHPQDQAGKELIKNIIHFISRYNLRNRMVFLEDYDINLARYLVQGVDVWLNNPLRPLEACGTSGMKAACNGALNLSVLDGWWDEAFDGQNGWAIGNREKYTDSLYQNEVESKAIYSTLEKDVIPLFYNRGVDGLPREWIKKVKYSMVSITSYFNTHRMVKEYFNLFYRNAAANYKSLLVDGAREIREFMKWKEKIYASFNKIRVEKLNFDQKRIYQINEEIIVEVELFLDNLLPQEIEVTAIFGKLHPDDYLIELSESRLENFERIADGQYLFRGKVIINRAGNFGLQIRITPAHPLMSNPYELQKVIWA